MTRDIRSLKTSRKAIHRRLDPRMESLEQKLPLEADLDFMALANPVTSDVEVFLVATGTSGDDHVAIQTEAGTGSIVVKINEGSPGEVLGTFSIGELELAAFLLGRFEFGGIQADLLGGNDTADAGALKYERAWLKGGDGRDTLIGGRAGDYFQGGEGSDTLVDADSLDLLLSGGSGIPNGDLQFDSLNSRDDAAGIMLFNTDVEMITASDASDVIDSSGYMGRDGAGVSPGDVGVDVDGLDGDDVLVGSDGDDSIKGGLGNDAVSGGSGGDDLMGAVGDDTIDGGTEDDVIEGGAGDDHLDGGAGDDVIRGGTDDDHLMSSAGADNETGGEGTDTIDYSLSPSPVIVDLNSNPQSGGWAEGDELREIENVTGSSGADTISGDDFNNVLLGNADADIIDGRGGDDTVEGGAGDDTLTGGAGDDTIDGNEGGDTIVGGADMDILNGGAGDDEIRGGSGMDVLLGGDGQDSLFGEDGADLLKGGLMDDLLDGGAQSDSLEGNEGHDVLIGGAGVGADTLDGGAGDDDLDGGRGQDIQFGDTGKDTIRVEYLVTTQNVRDVLLSAGSEEDTFIVNGEGQLGAPSAMNLLQKIDAEGELLVPGAVRNLRGLVTVVFSDYDGGRDSLIFV